MDTSLYPPRYQQKLLTLLSEKWDLDANTDGVLIHSDNFQALNLLQARYREQVKCIYIDPPYNTDSSAIFYKNSYKHSSWLSLIENRLSFSRQLMSDNSFLFVAIDDLELFRLNNLINDFYGEDNFIGNISVIHKPEGRNQEKFFGTSTEYMLSYAKNKSISNFRNVILDEEHKEKFDLVDDYGSYKRKNFIRLTDGKYALREAKPDFYYPIYVSLDLKHISLEKFDGAIEVFPITDSGVERTWKTKPSTLMEYYEQNNIEVIKENDRYVIYEKLRENQVIKTHWNKKEYHGYHYGTKILENILGNKGFSFPKSINLVFDTLKLCSENRDLILDYFAGSGTTAHAVINLNREDGGKRKYILVEQGEYFDTVLKPRVQKVIYSENWKNGKPMPSEKQSNGFNGVSQIVKVLKLESYEDTLNNIVLKGQDDFLKTLPENVREDYLLHYLLDTESKAALLNSDDFRHPFDYRLNIATDSAGAYQSTVIDLIETFNYLLGIRVQSITDEREKRAYVTVEGILPTGERALIVWRDVEKMGYAEVAKFFDKHNINPNSEQYDVVYLNGDHDMANQWQNEDGSESRLALRAIEPEFLNRMFVEKGE